MWRSNRLERAFGLEGAFVAVELAARSLNG